MSATPTHTPPRHQAPTRPSRRSTGRRVAAVVVVIAGSLLLLGGIDRATRETVTSTRTFDSRDIASVAIDTSAGDVTVSTGDRDVVEVVTRATSGLLHEAGTSLRHDGSALLLSGDCDGIGLRSCTVAFDVRVPRDMAADVTVDTLAGGVALRGLSGDVTVRTRAGAVELADFSGEAAAITTTAGTIEVDAGARTRSLDLQTTAGSIDVVVDDREPLRVDVDTTIGSQTVAVAQQADADRQVVARTAAGEIQVRGR